VGRRNVGCPGAGGSGREGAVEIIAVKSGGDGIVVALAIRSGCTARDFINDAVPSFTRE